MTLPLDSYKVELQGDTLMVDFNLSEPTQNNTLVQVVAHKLNDLITQRILGGPLLKINGAQSLPIAFAIAHKVAHLYGAVAIYDPKVKQYIVSISHNSDYPLGAQLP
jgi:CRISPR-associated protein Csx3